MSPKISHYCFLELLKLSSNVNDCKPLVVGLLKEFKVCPQCKTARYCGESCQKQDWNAGGHKTTCGTSAYSDIDVPRAHVQSPIPNMA